MPICTHCSTPLPSLYMRYGREHVVLSPCPPCSSANKGVILADAYLEHDLPIVIIDLILAKPGAYRHLLFNRRGVVTPSDASDGWKEKGGVRGDGGARVGETWEMVKRFLGLAMVDAYIRWFYVCVQPLATTASAVGNGTISDRIAGWVSKLPMQAGMFFPSQFTPNPHSKAVGSVCSSAPLWTTALQAEAADAIYSTLISYSNILCITLIESLALHLTISLLYHLISPKPKPPYLASKAILLSSLSPLILLTFVLLWSTKFPHPHSHPSAARAPIVWVIRTFLASLNAGVALATILPPRKGRRWTAFAPAAMLSAAWGVQAVVSGWSYRWLS